MNGHIAVCCVSQPGGWGMCGDGMHLYVALNVDTRQIVP